MSSNLERLHEAMRGLYADERESAEAFLLGWLAGGTPEAMWDAALREALAMVGQTRRAAGREA